MRRCSPRSELMCSLGPGDRGSFSGGRVLEKPPTGIFLQLRTERSSSRSGGTRLRGHAGRRQGRPSRGTRIRKSPGRTLSFPAPLGRHSRARLIGPLTSSWMLIVRVLLMKVIAPQSPRYPPLCNKAPRPRTTRNDHFIPAPGVVSRESRWRWAGPFRGTRCGRMEALGGPQRADGPVWRDREVWHLGSES